MTCDHSPTVRLHVAMLGGPEHCPSCLAARLAEAGACIRNAMDALNDFDEAGAHLILYEWTRKYETEEKS